jgi:hypothetical protein
MLRVTLIYLRCRDVAPRLHQRTVRFPGYNVDNPPSRRRRSCLHISLSRLRFGSPLLEALQDIQSKCRAERHVAGVTPPSRAIRALISSCRIRNAAPVMARSMPHRQSAANVAAGNQHSAFGERHQNVGIPSAVQPERLVEYQVACPDI